MDNLTLTPDLYSPNVNEDGNYIDYIPTYKIFEQGGLICPCGARKDKVYDKKNKFSSHIECATHKRWIESLNRNKANYYKKYLKLKDLIKTQKIMIGNLQKDIDTKSVLINHLTNQLILNNNLGLKEMLIKEENLIDL